MPQKILLAAVLGAAALLIGFNLFRGAQEQANLRASQDRLVAYHGLTAPGRKRLAPMYEDKQGRMVADAPADAEKLLDPDTLVLAHYQDADTETQLVDWEAIATNLAQATGKKIVRQEYLNSADDVAAIKAGQIHIVALHAADAPYVVNNAGFVPVANLGNEDGAHGNHLDIVVAARSNVSKLADLRGATLTCTTPDSITGYRAAIAVLAQEANLRPDVDYWVNFSHGQKKSVLGLAAGDFEIAALSDDKLQSMLGKGSVKADDYRTIYESQVVPRLTIGYVYNLAPERAAQVAAAVIDFTNESGPADEATGKPMRFYATDYKKDFEFVRRIDDIFDPRFHKRPKAIPVPEAEAAGSSSSPTEVETTSQAEPS